MPIRVRLSEIVEAMEMQSDELMSYLHRPTGRVLMISDEAIRAAEDDDADDAWVEPEELADARGVLASGDEYLALPDRFDIDEYRMMERFARGIEDRSARDAVSATLHGSGAFRRFKDAVSRYGIAPEWYAYRDAAYAEIARAWCEVNGIEHDSPHVSHTEDR